MTAASERAHVEESHRNLRALEAIEENPSISQRELARSMGVALGVANACVRTLVRKGLVKIRGESNRSITYHLTKEGRVQKGRLAMEWTGNTIEYYVQARTALSLLLQGLAARGVNEIALYGADEAAELVVMLAPHVGITVTNIVEARAHRISDSLLGSPVVSIDSLEPVRVDMVLACSALEADDVVRLRAAFLDAPIMFLNGQTLEETRA